MKKHQVLVAALALGIGSAAYMARAEDEKEGKEQKIAFNQVPEAAQKTLTEEAKGNKIENVDKEEKDGKPIYEADVVINGKNYEIIVAEDGTLISKKLDMEEGAKTASDKKGEKEEDEKNEKNEKAEKK